MPRFSLTHSISAFFSFIICAFSLFVVVQTTSAQTQDNSDSAVSVAQVDTTNLAEISNLLTRYSAVSLSVDRKDLEAAPRSLATLHNFVSGGGLILLHTDAAQLFGFRTVYARRGSNALGGQLFGRAHAALPFGAHPLLTANRSARSNDPTRLPGVNTVCYTLREGDVLVVDHPAGTPLLQATDLAQNAPSGTALYASAIAPYGRGWALVVPQSLDMRRGDGALFAANVRGFAPQRASDSLLPRWIGVAQSAFEGRGANLQNTLAKALQGINPGSPETSNRAEGARSLDDTIPNVVRTPSSTLMQAKDAVRTVSEPVLLLDVTEARAVLSRLNTDSNAVKLLLQARVAVLRGDYARAQALLNTAPDVAERAIWLGVVASAGAVSLAQSSVARAALTREAATQFERALSLPIFFNRPENREARGSAFVSPLRVAGLPTPTIQAANTEFLRLSKLFALEPPEFQVVETGNGRLIFRFFEGDSALPALAETGIALARAQSFGWSVNEQEILMFPDPSLYVNLRRAMGQGVQNVPFPAGEAGDVIGGRILLLSLPTAPIVRSLPNGQAQVSLIRTTGLQIFARLQAYALLAIWLDGTGRVPAWMALGMENLAADALGAETSNSVQRDTLLGALAQAGRLLSSEQIEAQRGAPSDLAQTQSMAMMAYFYRAFGAGAVTETVQRLGAGQSPGDALTETTGGDENAFFRSWLSAQSGGRALFNR